MSSKHSIYQKYAKYSFSLSLLQLTIICFLKKRYTKGVFGVFGVLDVFSITSREVIIHSPRVSEGEY